MFFHVLGDPCVDELAIRRLVGVAQEGLVFTEWVTGPEVRGVVFAYGKPYEFRIMRQILKQGQPRLAADRELDEIPIRSLMFHHAWIEAGKHSRRPEQRNRTGRVPNQLPVAGKHQDVALRRAGSVDPPVEFARNER